jgi:CHAT domain-containing protein
VVSSLWRAGDAATAEFMGLFYHHLARGNDKAQALRLAKLDLLKGRYAAPFYWATFVLSGDGSSTVDIH